MGRFDTKPEPVASPAAKPRKPPPKREDPDEVAGPINVDEVDRGAHALLRAVNKEGTLADRTKAFVAVTGWLELRSKIAPPDKGPSKFERLQSNIRNSRTTVRRGDAPETEAAEPEDDD